MLLNKYEAIFIGMFFVAVYSMDYVLWNVSNFFIRYGALLMFCIYMTWVVSSIYNVVANWKRYKRYRIEYLLRDK